MINNEWVLKLRDRPVHIEPRVAKTRWDGLYWRFEVFDRADCEYALVRDADSIPSSRERDLTLEWIHSGKKIHIIRDHPNHTWPINAGMWGAQTPFPFKFENAINQWKWKRAKCGDQHLLRRIIYRRYYRESLIHTAYVALKGEDVRWIDPSSDFVGRRFFDPDEPIMNAQRLLLPRENLLYEFRLEIDFYRRKYKDKLFKLLSKTARSHSTKNPTS